MAKRKKKPTTAAETAPPAPRVLNTISEQKLRTLLRFATKTQKDISELAGTVGEKIASAVENDNLHRKAFNIVKGLHKLEDEKLADALDYLDHYLDISGCRDRAAKVLRLLDDQPGAEAGEGDEKAGDEASEADAAEGDGRTGATVRPFPAPRGERAEA